jgi:hypothetical protein
MLSMLLVDLLAAQLLQLLQDWLPLPQELILEAQYANQLHFVA